jgi:hypothetical protein
LNFGSYVVYGRHFFIYGLQQGVTIGYDLAEIESTSIT